MLRYLGSAMALKFFSANRHTKRAYRALGNLLGERKRKGGTHVDAYIERGNLFRELSAKHDITKDGDNMLEIGTGWLHWHSIYHRLFYNVNISMLDIWDCRQFGAIRPVFLDVEERIAETLHTNEAARQNIETVVTAQSLDNLYSELGLGYHVDETGSLQQFADESFDCVFSFHVLEHVRRKYVDQLVKEIDRVLRPGGFSLHQIGIDDHLQHYDPKMSQKNYIRYSDRMWKLLFENDVQYFNRLQTSEWTAAFGNSDLVPLESITEHCNIDLMTVNRRFSGFSKGDLSCTALTIVHQKPGAD